MELEGLKKAVEKCPYRDECNKNKMKIIPFRIIPSDELNNYSEIYAFLIKGTNKDPYETEIEIDDFKIIF